MPVIIPCTLTCLVLGYLFGWFWRGHVEAGKAKALTGAIAGMVDRARAWQTRSKGGTFDMTKHRQESEAAVRSILEPQEQADPFDGAGGDGSLLPRGGCQHH